MSGSSGPGGREGEPKRVLVTGATGKQGGAVARLLLRRGHRVRALTRKPESAPARELQKAGAEVVTGDLGNRSSVERAAKGIDVAFVVATPYEQGPATETTWAETGIDAARAAGVPYIVYSSVSDADRKTGIPHFDSKFAVEEHLRELGTDYSIVAPVFFMDNLLASWIAAGLAKGVLAMGVLPDHKLQMISVAEIAEYTTLAIERRETFRGKRVNLASDELTPVEIAQRLSEATGTKVTYVPVPIAEVAKQSADTATMFDWFNRVGYSVRIPELRRAYPEVHWTTFREWASAQSWGQVLGRSPKS